VNEWDVYWFPVEFRGSSKKKERPVAILRILSSVNSVDGYGVYTEKTYWKQFSLIKYTFMYKPVDYNFAGISYDSYINVSDFERIKYKTKYLGTYAGKLSNRDIIGLNNAILKYNAFKERVIADDIENISSYLDLRETSVSLAKFYALDQRTPQISSYDFYLNDENINISKLHDVFRSSPQFPSSVDESDS
jgi:hypothetical protein